VIAYRTDHFNQHKKQRRQITAEIYDAAFVVVICTLPIK